MVKLENWSIRSRPLGQLQPPEGAGTCLHGFVIGHPQHQDGKQVFTSLVAARHADRVLTRSGSEYELGETDPDYERLYPSARQRLLARLEPCSEPAQVLVGT